eukprot:106047-Amphidinium_carterae.1
MVNHTGEDADDEWLWPELAYPPLKPRQEGISWNLHAKCAACPVKVGKWIKHDSANRNTNAGTLDGSLHLHNQEALVAVDYR